MSKQDIKARLAALDPLWVDIAGAIALAVLVCLQIYGFTHLRQPPPGMEEAARLIRQRPERSAGLLAYVLAASAFLPLAFRRSVPWLALSLSAVAALAYQLLPMPPAFVTLGPMIALYTLATHSSKRRTGLVALLVAGIVLAVPVSAFSGDVRWVADSVSTFVLLAAAALLGEAERNRRQYIAQVEQRAADAERTREEEALRRVDEERIRIAREVHDIVAHSLSIVTVQAGAASALMQNDPARASESIDHVRNTAKSALAELRSMLDVLRTGDGEAPLTPTADLTRIETLLSPVREAGLEVELQTAGDLASVPAYASVSAYRIVQEALTNVVRHAKATSAQLSIEVLPDSLHIHIEDNGTFRSDLLTGGHGLEGMRERVEALSGTFELGTGTQGGLAVDTTIPLKRSAS
ncbi:MAG: sensor histidine kinase [Actinobacteria bacterium]|nr:sensor histidine kinase [Actinomycetota bacterium]MCG2807615.1 sensor histidine kinase [Coriobacteriia bacterium]